MRTSWTLIVFMVMGLLLAQTKGGGGEAASNTTSWQRANILDELMYGGGRRGKLLVLDRLATMVDQGQLKADDVDLINVLSEMAEQGVMVKHYDKSLNLVNNYVMIRSAAVKILGKLGGPLASSRLAEILEDEDESLVMTIAMEAYRESVEQQTSHSVGILVHSFMRMHERHRDNTFASRYLDVVKALVEEDRGLLVPEVIYSVQRVAWDGSGYVAPVRNKALSLLLSWL